MKPYRDKNDNIHIKGLTFDWTCGEQPEEYEVYDQNQTMVGYVHLKYGRLDCEYPNLNGETVFDEQIGNAKKGSFADEKERFHYLTIIAEKILEKVKENK